MAVICNLTFCPLSYHIYVVTHLKLCAVLSMVDLLCTVREFILEQHGNIRGTIIKKIFDQEMSKDLARAPVIEI